MNLDLHPRLECLDFLPARILRNIDVDPDSDCLLWTASTSNSGYAHATGPKTMERMYLGRWVLEATVGPAFGMTMSHDCHDRDLNCPDEFPEFCWHRLCLNPEHLSWKTMRDNLLSSPRTGASRWARGCRDTGRYTHAVGYGRISVEALELNRLYERELG